MMEFIAKMINNFQPLTIFTKTPSQIFDKVLNAFLAYEASDQYCLDRAVNFLTYQ